MERIGALLRDRWFWLFVGLCAGGLALLVLRGADIEDALASLVLLGLALPLIALATCWRLPRPGRASAWQSSEAATLIGLVMFVAAILMVKQPLLAHLLPETSGARLRETTNTLFKLAVFVAIPYALLRRRHGGLAAAGAVLAPRWRLVLCFVLLSIVAWVLQALIGSEFIRLSGRHADAGALLIAGALCFLWNSVEAGLVEEFFFRRVLQSRLSAWTGSEVSAIFIGALIFGLAHLPGIWLRGAGVSEGLGATPSLLTTAAYVIVTQGVAGLMFGVLWARTRSLTLLVLLHGMFDTPSNLARFMDIWGLQGV
jgi:uncharacterized protein